MWPTGVRDSADALAAAASDFVWAQWSLVGGAAPSGRHPHEIVDVEALTIASLALATREPRLGSIAREWCGVNRDLVSTTRLTALRRRLPIALDIAMPRRASAKAAPPRWHGPATLLLQLRRAFGVGVRADLLAVLSGRREEWTDVATLVQLTGYSTAGLRRAADELANAGFVQATTHHRRSYRIMAEQWRALLPGTSQAVWRRRADAFVFVATWLRLIDEKAASTESTLPFVAAWREYRITFDRLWLEIDESETPTTDADAWQSVARSIHRLARWFQ